MFRFLITAGAALMISLPLGAEQSPITGIKADLHDMAAAASAANIERDIRTLVGFGTRHTL